jgi:hypothetical protein
MSVDAYTKGILTVIALALVTIAIQNVIQPAVAQVGVQRVTICDPLGGDCHGMPLAHHPSSSSVVRYPAVVVVGTYQR